jgi:hypothetical protein
VQDECGGDINKSNFLEECEDKKLKSPEDETMHYYCGDLETTGFINCHVNRIVVEQDFAF